MRIASPSLPNSRSFNVRIALSIPILFVTTFIACQRPVNGPDRPNDDETVANRPAGTDSVDSGFSATIQDSLDRTVTVTKRPQRIVSLAPTHTEILFAVGAGDRVSGVTTHCNYPAEASRRKQVGGFSPETLSIETIVGLQPDLILSTGSLHHRIIDALEPLGVPVAGLDAASIEDVYRNVEIVGRLTGRVEQAEKVAADLRARVERVQQRLRSTPKQETPSVFYLVWDQPLMTVGSESYISELIRSAGGRNIFDDVKSDYPQISAEEVIARNPQIILAAASGAMEMRRRAIVDRPGWQDLDAVRHQRIHFVDADLVSRPGPRLIEIVERIAVILHPDLFSAPTRRSGSSGEDSARGSGKH